VHKHVGDAVKGDAEASAKSEVSKEAAVEEAVGAETGGRDGVDDSEDIVRFKGALAGLMVGLVEVPNGSGERELQVRVELPH
jgi:hypothetical protein